MIIVHSGGGGGGAATHLHDTEIYDCMRCNQNAV
jgi:hypothetical protein